MPMSPTTKGRIATAVFWVIGLSLLAFGVRYVRPAYDDTDDAASGTRSGMNLHTDHKTGCQYLSRGGQLILRIDGQGNHVGCKK